MDLNAGAIEWGVEWEARKYDASRRVVPAVAPLLSLLKRTYMEQGRPKEGLVCPQRADWATTGHYPYSLPVGTRRLSVSVQGPSNTTPQFTHGLLHQFGLVDLYAYPNVESTLLHAAGAAGASH